MVNSEWNMTDYANDWDVSGAMTKVTTSGTKQMIEIKDSSHFFWRQKVCASIGIDASNQVSVAIENRVASIGVEYFSQTH